MNRPSTHTRITEDEDMVKVHYTSDIHIGHRKIAMIRAAAFGNDLPFDPEVDDAAAIQWHDNTLAHNWDAAIGKDDDVWIVGDISSGTNSAQLGALEWLAERPGNKYLIIGNHDGCHPMYRDAHKWMKIYSEYLAAPPMMAARRRLSLPEGHCNAVVSHFPYKGDTQGGAERFTQWRLPNLGKDYIIHGHTHRPEKFGGMQIHVGVDAWEMKPVPLEAIARYAMHLDWENNGRR